MRNRYFILAFVYCLSGFLYAQQTEGSGVVSYPDNNIKVVGEKVFWSVNPKIDNSSESDLLTIYYKGLYNRRNSYLSGIRGTIDKPGGYIKIEVHAYDSKRVGGLQLETDDDKTFVTRPIYNVEITQSSLNAFSKTTKEMDYLYWDRGIHSRKVPTDDIKTLVARSLSALKINCGGMVWNWLRAFSLVRSSCSLEIDDDKLIQLENQPVVIKITVKDATLYDIRVPAVARNENLKSIIQKEYPYFVIKKVNIEVLEAPEDNNPASFYEDMVRKAFDWANKVYTAKTGMMLSDEAVVSGAKVGNARIIFKDIAITIRKGLKEGYDEANIFKYEKDDDLDIRSLGKREIFIKYVSKIITLDNLSPQGTTFIYRLQDKKNNIDEMDNIATLLVYNPSPHSEVKNATAHELGHYFGLQHTFRGGCNGSNDKISDTPPAEDLSSGADFGKNCIAPVQCGGHRRLIENMMDYGNCRFMFTPGQVKVMRNSIKKDYPELYTTQRSTDAAINTDLNITVRDLRVLAMRRKRSIEEDKLEKSQNIILYPNPVKDVLNIDTLENEDFEIFSFNWQRVLSGKTQAGQIDVGILSKGIYIIKIKGIDHKFIKE
ncbi:M43 family zinc metalloprotease [Flavobacterium poyangense]|uniref:M43 family zinc metalloprotease n=1 Tax=Flavobacterium poyangense TaxID=2204302 RepID=UPI001421D218|nr:M43 family zinc metalloprotease [Flavobacterium sp. JXAS1]